MGEWGVKVLGPFVVVVAYLAVKSLFFYFWGKIHFSGPKSMGWVGGWVSQVYEFVLDNDVFKPSQRSFFYCHIAFSCGAARSMIATSYALIFQRQLEVTII